MSKVGVNVGAEFPAEEVQQPEKQEDRDREEWRRRHEEWHARARAFKEDVRRAARKHFGEHSFLLHNMFMLRVLVAVLALALLIALLPHMLLLGIVLTASAFIAFQRHRFHHHYRDVPPDGAGV